MIKINISKDSSIYIAGHTGLVGSAVLRLFSKEGYRNIITSERKKLDLTNSEKVDKWFSKREIEYVIDTAAKVGGIINNRDHPAEFIFKNLKIQTNLIHSSYKYGVKKFIFLGSSCIYPRLAPQPMKEEYLLSGTLEETNKAYAVAKIAGIIMCQAYWKQYGFQAVSLMPTNIYGPNDNFDLQDSHVIPALIRKFFEAKLKGDRAVEVWGTGDQKREFLFVDDLANAILFALNNYSEPKILNVGTGEDITIKDLAILIKDIVGYEGNILFNNRMPEGVPRKLLDVSKIHSLGWKPIFSLKKGIKISVNWYKNHFFS